MFTEKTEGVPRSFDTRDLPREPWLWLLLTGFEQESLVMIVLGFYKAYFMI